ncbi:MAG TPA: pitrilysin family protein [Candidatus Saccharimonadales bacterium]|jgi:zinc protease|nr:pitrilysin family protein [Candidatus Saccharimonadales bacterium]
MHKKLSILILVAVFLMAGVAAQTPGGDSKQLPAKVTRLNKAPISIETLRVKLPHPVEVRMPNGLTLLVLEQHRLPTLTCALWVKAGALSDPKEMPGLASFTADLLREGTVKRNSTQIAADLDELGATFAANAPFGDDVTYIQSSGLSSTADKLMDLMSDMVLNPGFPEEEIEKYRRREAAGLTQQRSSPGFLAQERFARAVYGDFPASIQTTTSDALKKASPAALKEFHDRVYAPNNAILAIGGDVTVAQATELVKKYFGQWKGHPATAKVATALPAPAPARIFLVDRPGSVQSNILAGALTLRRNDPDYIPLVVANRILGGGGAARLFMNLREEKGYTYGAYSRLNVHAFPGTLAANTEVRNAVTDGSLHELMYELKRLRDERVPQGEMEEASRSIVSSFALSLESPANLLNSWLTVKYYGLPNDYWDTYADRIAAVNAETVQRVARKFVDLEHLQIVVVGDAKQVREAVEKYGKVELFDTDGKAVVSKPETAPSGK